MFKGSTLPLWRSIPFTIVYIYMQQSISYSCAEEENWFIHSSFGMITIKCLLRCLFFKKELLAMMILAIIHTLSNLCFTQYFSLIAWLLRCHSFSCIQGFICIIHETTHSCAVISWCWIWIQALLCVRGRVSQYIFCSCVMTWYYCIFSNKCQYVIRQQPSLLVSTSKQVGVAKNKTEQLAKWETLYKNI